MQNIIEKLKEAELAGRSGSNFPVWKKWQTVKNATSSKKYVICNASEGEPEVFKDGFILENFPQEVINGIKIALDFLPGQSAYIYINEDYYKKYKEKLTQLIGNLAIEFCLKPRGYLKGEETVAMEVIEGKRPEPRIRPPFPTESGLWGQPTLINNVETFYYVSKIAKDEYRKTRFYSISGDAPKKSVFELPESLTIQEILQQTGNLPQKDFFVQAGGGAIGEILLLNELEKTVQGIGSIVIFDRQKTSPIELMLKWGNFFMEENCDKCAPCREGIYRLMEILQQTQAKMVLKSEASVHKTDSDDLFDKTFLSDIFLVLEKSSLCPFGRSAITPFKTAIEKLL